MPRGDQPCRWEGKAGKVGEECRAPEAVSQGESPAPWGRGDPAVWAQHTEPDSSGPVRRPGSVRGEESRCAPRGEARGRRLRALDTDEGAEQWKAPLRSENVEAEGAVAEKVSEQT